MIRRTEAELRQLLALAIRLGFWDDVAEWKRQLRELKRPPA